MLAFNHLGVLGRLGNQMFQYASLRGIAAARGYDFGIPPSDFSDEWMNHQLFEVFDLPHLPQSNIRFLDSGCAPVVQEKQFLFDVSLLQQCPNEVSLWGFFQTEKYFKHIEASIKEDFTFRDEILNPCKEMIGDNRFLSLHIRRTDYLTNSENLHNWDVVIFSDDPEWCKKQKLFQGDRFLISESGDNKVDMCLQTLCKAHIIANSSFSWWGAWLAGSDNVIAPSKWFGPLNEHKDTSDLIPERWHRI